MVGGAPLDVADLVGEMEALAIDPALAGSTSDGCSAIPNLMVAAMDVFTKLFGNLLAFVYHCFDRIVIHGYLSALSRPEQVVHFVRKVVGVPVVSKKILSQHTAVEALSRPSTLIELEPSLVSAFRREAAKRDVSLDRLVHDLLEPLTGSPAPSSTIRRGRTRGGVPRAWRR